MRGFELISRRTGSEASYYLFDGGMSVRGITDEEGNLTNTLVFDAFGNEAERTGTTENSYGFQGEEQDSTGLYYLRARYMDPSTGTFTSMDTYGGSLSDPMSLHKYLFANSNPVKWCDPSGHMTLAETLCVFAIIGELTAANLYLIKLNYSSDYVEYNNYDFAKYIIVGAIIGLFIGFIVFFIAYVIPVLISFFGNGSDEAETIVEKLSDKSSNGSLIYSIADKTTTVLGRYGRDMKRIISELGIPKLTEYNGNPGGFNILNVPDELIRNETFWREWNLPFLQAALERGDKFIFATDIWTNLFYEGSITGYGKEVFYLLFYKIFEVLSGG